MTEAHRHSQRCILSAICRERDGGACSPICPSYIAMHGLAGESGRIGNAQIPKDYRLTTLANSPVRASQPEAYGLIDAYASTFVRQHDAEAGTTASDVKRIKSVYLVSRSPGTGKTTTAASLLNEYIIVSYVGAIMRGRQPQERVALFVDVNEMQSLYNTFNRPRVPDHIAEPAAAKYYALLTQASTIPYAVLDDIGVRDCTEGFRGDLHGIINARVSAGLPTCYTSNVPIGELAQIYDERLADRVRDMCVEIPFKGESKRGMRK